MEWSNWPRVTGTSVRRHSARVTGRANLNPVLIPPSIPRRGGPVMRALGSATLRLMRFRIEGELPNLSKFVIIVAPHTSNWDFVVGLAARYVLGLDVAWLGKHTLFRAPFGALFRRWGGIPVDRRA